MSLSNIGYLPGPRVHFRIMHWILSFAPKKYFLGFFLGGCVAKKKSMGRLRIKPQPLRSKFVPRSADPLFPYLDIFLKDLMANHISLGNLSCILTGLKQPRPSLGMIWQQRFSQKRYAVLTQRRIQREVSFHMHYPGEALNTQQFFIWWINTLFRERRNFLENARQQL